MNMVDKVDVMDVFPARPRRKEPSLFKIACHWQDKIEDDPDWWPHFKGLYIGLGEPFCFRCGWLAPVDDTVGPENSWPFASGWLDRAHLIDRCDGGLDGAQNIIPLCQLCHAQMPEFRSGSEDQALEWVRQPFQRPFWWQIWTDSLPPEVTRGRLKKAWLQFSDVMGQADGFIATSYPVKEPM